MGTLLADTSSSFDTAMLILRLALGPMLFAHGYQKLFLGGRIEGTAGWFESMGMKPGKLNAWAAALTETGTGVLMTIGLLTPFAAAGMVGVMVVAWFTHRGEFFVFKDGWEYNFVIGAVAIAVGTLGAGQWSVDHLLGIGEDLAGWTGLAISAGLGLVAGFGTLALFHRPDPPTADT
ncbi:MAG: DoxX family protein [Actinomycetia bacterium]|nr:DoxX family protein [Actinomycetes bacterium]